MMASKISIVSPVYRAENILVELVKQIDIELTENNLLDYEIILVEDASPDNSWQTIENICQTNKKVKGIKLSKNSGQHNAITCGLDHATGDLIIVMDCDLQHDPKDFQLFLNELKEKNCDLIFGIQKTRKHSLFKNITAQVFYYFYNLLSDIPSNKFSGELSGFVLMKSKVKNELLKIREQGSHFLLNLRLVGFEYSTVEIKHLERFEGTSSYNFTKLFNHAINGLTAHSTKILRLSIYVGSFMFLISFVFAAITFYKYFFENILAGFTSIITIIVFLSGAIMFMLGIIGLYLGKTFEQVKNRPLYHVSKKLN